MMLIQKRKKIKHVILEIWKIHILPLLSNLLHNICQVRAESREVKNPTFRSRDRRETKCFFFRGYLTGLCLQIAPTWPKRQWSAPEMPGNWSKMGWNRKLAMEWFPPFEVSLILKVYRRTHQTLHWRGSGSADATTSLLDLLFHQVKEKRNSFVLDSASLRIWQNHE